MALTMNAKAYTADGFQSDSVHFQGPAKTTTVKDDVIRKRYAARGATPTNSGRIRYLLKLTRTHALTGALSSVGDGSTEVLFTLPVGVSDADRDAHCNDVGAYIASAAFKADLKSQQVNG